MERTFVLPSAEVPAVHLLPDAIFLPGDHFHQDYKETPEAVSQYSIYTQLCLGMQPSSIFEIGVRAGYSAWAMLAGSPGALYHGLDLDQGTDGGVIGYSEHAKALLAHCYPDATVEINYGDSQQLTELPREYDLIHIDGDHSYQGALHDLELCARYTDHVLIDDITFLSDVASAVAEFLDRHLEAYKLEACFFHTWRGHVLIRTGNMRRSRT